MKGVRGAALAFVVSTLASLGLATAYVLGDQPQLEGVLLGLALGGLAVGLITWARNLMPSGPYTQAREPTAGQAWEREEMEEVFEEG
ncbi:MAG TPA: hypothetical protein VET24_12345, partial [Actinomycetota bacterium]|nr:hypothetical protein [Actinomycetota bacterium]